MSLWKYLSVSLALLLGLSGGGCSGNSDIDWPGSRGTGADADSTTDDSDASFLGANTHDDGGSSSDESCRRVDVLIALDASQSMTEELEAARQTVFPAFAKRLVSISKGLDDFRVATIDACPTPANFHTRGAAGECNFDGGNPWIESSSRDIEGEFACVGDIYVGDAECSGDNDDEQPASAAATALEKPFLSGANKGFLRDDALLIIVAVTDEDEQPTNSANTATEIYKRIVAIKGGEVRRMVFVGIGAEHDCTGVGGSAGAATKLKAVTDLFAARQRGVWWDLCNGHLEDGVEEASAVIESACDELPDIIE
ncbi:MAG: hypothetical protein MUF54_00510 [Polyangiaceae bacterium]|nr:hypothetical protein [Polyangiaceae bacterium]